MKTKATPDEGLSISGRREIALGWGSWVGCFVLNGV